MSTPTQPVKNATQLCSDPKAELIFDNALKVLGDFWTIRVLESLMEGPLRYCEVERALKHVNPVTLTKRLKLLEDSGYIVRQVETIDRQSVAYELTGKGRETRPVIEAIKTFSITYQA